MTPLSGLRKKNNCSRQKISVTRQITFPDGSPLTEGNIIFESETFQGFSFIDKEGHYNIRIHATSGGDSDGTPLVRYVAKKYEAAGTSGLTCDVDGKTEYNITIEKP